MKQSEALRQLHFNVDLNRLTTTDLLALFPRPDAPNYPLLSPLRRIGLPSGVGDASEFVSGEGNDVEKRRISAQALLEGHGSTEDPWTERCGPPEACVAELDLLHLAQYEAIRPTTCMRDGYHDCIASTWSDFTKEKHPPTVTGDFSSPRSKQCCGASDKAVHNQAVQDHVPYSLHSCSRERAILAGQMLEARNDIPNDAMASDAAVHPTVPSSTGQDASELGPSQLQRQKVPSRSSLPGNLRPTLSREQEKLTGSGGSGAGCRIISTPLLPEYNGSTRPTHRVQARGSILREDTYSPQVSPVGLIGSTSDTSSPAVARRARLVGDCNPFPPAMGKTKGSSKLATEKFTEHAKALSLKTLEYKDRAASDLASRSPTDVSYMIAVTESEMALLVMMRHKRAVMKKSSSEDDLDLL
ncbi:hypothetical protein LTR56_014681 [Elasticomyces elasticus]|nr:hypothetical protein LTR56_014681 [Elasticomyces elasticus]KAK3636800.1 hypothetical protein LTR22_018553 [Elasticomyces elasticus]KAK4912504.1 hypothetical protein LTR49_019048 [Elasticomyces elasticus]KAK5751870.1 hypothetical protein LTS12_018048 [Elasticomyces elasticus]